MFPDRAPGVALVLLRVSIGSGILFNSSLLYPSVLGHWDLPARSALDLLLLCGVFTPWVALLACTLSILDLVGASSPGGQVAFLTIVNALALGLLGPGAYSADARIFGRHLLVLPKDDSDLS